MTMIMILLLIMIVIILLQFITNAIACYEIPDIRKQGILIKIITSYRISLNVLTINAMREV